MNKEHILIDKLTKSKVKALIRYFKRENKEFKELYPYFKRKGKRLYIGLENSKGIDIKHRTIKSRIYLKVFSVKNTQSVSILYYFILNILKEIYHNGMKLKNYTSGLYAQAVLKVYYNGVVWEIIQHFKRADTYITEHILNSEL